MTKLCLRLIECYQRFVSPFFAPRCRFTPSCSHFAHEALQRYGFLRGCWLTLKRLLRCQPLFAGGYDPVP